MAEDDDEPDFKIPPKKRRRHAEHYLVRQESGQFVYKYKNVEGVWCAKRLPKKVVFYPDAVEWVNINMLGAKDTRSVLDKLRNLAANAATPGERDAALNAIAVIERKQKK